MSNKKMISNSIERMEDASLENVSGGGEKWNKAVYVAANVALVSAPASLVFCAGSAICQYRSKKRREQGNVARAKGLSTAGLVFSSLATGTAAVATIGGGMVFGTNLYYKLTEPVCVFN